MPADASSMLLEDLNKSGLVPQDLDAYVAQETELAAVGIRPHMYLESPGVGSPGYVIPYYDITGARAPFYRVRLFKPLPKGAKYLQPSNTGSWVYFPKNFPKHVEAAVTGKSRSKINGFDPVLIICEGEKKASAAIKSGFLCAGLGGVFNWRTRTMLLPEGTQLLKTPHNEIIAKLNKGGEIAPTSDRKAVLAGGLKPLIDLAKQHKMQVVIVFDKDEKENMQVQRAAAELAFELRTNGVAMDHIRQIMLPGSGKVGLDDFLTAHGPDALTKLLETSLSLKNAFPKHPDLKSLINNRMDAQITRSEARELSLFVLADMDSNGMRMIERGSGTPYYFDSRSKRLMRVNLLHHHQEPLHETRFGEFLYNTYDLGQADTKLLYWLASGFTGEQPVVDVNPRSVVALLPNNRIAYQLDDGHFLVVGGDSKVPIRIAENGSEGLLFRSDQVEPVDGQKVLKEFHKQVRHIREGKFEHMLWPMALKQFKFARPSDVVVMSLLCYMSPWLLRWNGTQLPVELMIGEPGSGKSSMYSLRLQILTGRPALRNQPTDIRDWYSSITAQDGLHVIDNVHFASKELRQRLSDEICRIVTEPHPTVELRKLFTTAEVARMPVRTVFAVTAVQQPFMNADILQRSMIFELHAVGKEHASDWASQQIVGAGGREVWLAHQLAVLHLFFEYAEKHWNPSYRSTHRLANFEQLFLAMGKVLKVDNVAEVAAAIVQVAEEQVSEYDWTMEALKEFAIAHLPLLQKDPKKIVTTQDMATWCMSREDFSDNQVATNSRRLARYIKSHMYMVEKCTGLFLTDVRYANREGYRIKLPPK